VLENQYYSNYGEYITPPSLYYYTREGWGGGREYAALCTIAELPKLPELPELPLSPDGATAYPFLTGG
jgi:hypothetical protein